MMASHDSRLLFVHVQKTGGSTIDEVLQQVFPDAEKLPGPGGRHVGLQQILKRHPHVADFWIFGFVRNPWARMYSWWAMIERVGEAVEAGDPETTERLGKIQLWRTVLAQYESFEEFVLKGTRDVPELAKPQVAYLRSRTRHADFVGRQETFEQDMRAVLARYDKEWPGAIPRVNASATSTDYRDFYSEAMRERVGEVFAKDVRRFGYAF